MSEWGKCCNAEFLRKTKNIQYKFPRLEVT